MNAMLKVTGVSCPVVLFAARVLTAASGCVSAHALTGSLVVAIVALLLMKGEPMAALGSSNFRSKQNRLSVSVGESGSLPEGVTVTTSLIPLEVPAIKSPSMGRGP